MAALGVWAAIAGLAPCGSAPHSQRTGGLQASTVALPPRPQPPSLPWTLKPKQAWAPLAATPKQATKPFIRHVCPFRVLSWPPHARTGPSPLSGVTHPVLLRPLAAESLCRPPGREQLLPRPRAPRSPEAADIASASRDPCSPLGTREQRPGFSFTLPGWHPLPPPHR